MFKFLFFILIFYFVGNSLGQDNYQIKKDFWQLLSENKLESIYKKQQFYLKKLQSDNSKEKLAILISIQYVNQQFSDFEKALSFEDEIYKGLRFFYGNESFEMQDHLSRLSQIYSSISDWEKLKMIENQNVNISFKVFGGNSAEYAQATLNFSTTLSDLDEFSSAFKMNKIGYEIALKLQNETQMVQGLINYGRTYFKLDQIEKSYENYSKALDLIENSKKDLNTEYQIVLSNLIGVYLKLGDLSNASKCSQLIMSIRKELYGSKNEKYALSILQNANIYYASFDYGKAINEYLEAKKILDKLKLNQTYYYFTLLNNLSMCYNEFYNYEKSIFFYNQSKKLAIKLFGTENLEMLRLNSNLASILMRKGNSVELIQTLLSSVKFGCDFFINRRIGLSTNEQIALKNIIDNKFHILLSKSNYLSTSQLSNLYSSWINFNGIINSDWKLIQRTNIINKSFIDQSEKLVALKLKYLNSINSENFNSSLNKNLKYEIEHLESEISELTPFKLKKVLLSEISNQIESSEIFIDFINISNFNFDKYEWTDSTQYLVFITDSKDSLVDYVFIEDGTKIDQDLFDQYKQEATDPERKTDLKSEKFYNYFWKPISDKIGDAKTIYVSLGGVYNNINLNTIYNPTTGKYLLEEKDIRIVNSAREFILNKERATKTYTNNTASLFGFPNFDGNTTVSAEVSDLFASTRDLNSFWLDSLTRGGLKAKPLPATKTEVENISATLKSKGWQVTNYLADNASETNLKTQQSPRVLHIATHGYFFPDIPMEDKDQTRFLGMDRQQVVQDPMLRSGLLLTGANRTLKGEVSTGENGLLSAAEASLLDLRETELVVLSACETGKGEVKNSEGVYGLRKAFSDAGAQNIIMSLWKVDDKVTQEFMSRFYQLWLNDKTTIREAFHKTQLEIKEKYPQPYYWGAFILVGE